jgi:hypothetical protein
MYLTTAFKTQWFWEVVVYSILREALPRKYEEHNQLIFLMDTKIKRLIHRNETLLRKQNKTYVWEYPFIQEYLTIILPGFELI